MSEQPAPHGSLLDLIGRNTSLRRVARKDGGEYVGPCPFCQDGNDRFHVWPDAQQPRYWCRQCGKKGDAIQYLRDHDGLSYRQACDALGMAPGARRPAITLTERLLQPRPAPRPTEATPARDMLQAIASHLHAALLDSERARAYLAGRRIPLEVAEAAGVGYLPRTATFLKWYERVTLQNWLDRLIFPLSSPDGRGYTGRTLRLWQPGMDENEHKRRTDLPGAPRRWEKTAPAGWGGLDTLAPDSRQVVLVEGSFDRLALAVAGVPIDACIALCQLKDSRAVDWLPHRVRRIIIAVDSGESEQEAAQELSQALYKAGKDTTICTPPDDGQGKDWSERLRIAGVAGLLPVLEAFNPPEEVTSSAVLPWRAVWDKLYISQQVYQMARVLGFPAYEHISAGDSNAWHDLAEGSAEGIASAYESLLPHFQR